MADKTSVITDSTAAYRPPPPHYENGKLQPWQVWEAFGFDPWEAAAFKYLARWRHKDGLDDLYKLRDYVGYLIEREENRT